MEAVISNFDEYLKAFGLTIGSVRRLRHRRAGVRHAPRRPPGRPGGDPQQGGGALRHAGPQHAAADDLRLHGDCHAGARLQLQVRRGRRDRGLQRLRLLLPLPALRSPSTPRPSSARPLRSGVNAVPLGQAEAGTRHRAALRGSRCARSSSPRPSRAVDPAAGQRLDRAAQEHLGRGGLRRRRGHCARCGRFTNDNADQRIGIFLAFAIGYIILVELDLAVVLPRRATVEGGPMSASVLFDAPGPGRSPGTGSTRSPAWSRSSALVAFAVWTMYDAGQLEYAIWEPFLTPEYIEAILVDGLLKTLQMAFFAIIFAVVFGLVFGVAKLSDHEWVRRPAWLVVEFFRAVPVLLLMVFCLLHAGHRRRAAELVLVRGHRADALQRRGPGRGLPRRHQRRARAARPRRRTPSACASRR